MVDPDIQGLIVAGISRNGAVYTGTLVSPGGKRLESH